jgi:Sortase domain
MKRTRYIKYILLGVLLFALSTCSSSTAMREASMGGLNNSKAAALVAMRAAATKQLARKISALPLRLILPTIDVNAFIENVGTLPGGDLATPTAKPWEDVGWYSDGPHPGERGSAVIDGHLDRPGGYPAVFWRLRDMHVGDPVLVTASDGKQLRFHVTHIVLFTPQDAPLQDIFGNRSGIYLNLITCAGDWIPSQHQTTLRLVVYTALG